MKWSNAAGEPDMVVSHAGHALVRPVSFRFAFDPTSDRARRFAMFAGARRYAFNHHVARVKANLEQRSHERETRVDKDQMTPALSWSTQSFINEFNSWKNGHAADSPTSVAADPETGELVEQHGLHWRHEVSADVFECASVDAARAFRNYSDSAKGARVGIRVGFPRFQARHHAMPTFPAAVKVQARCHRTCTVPDIEDRPAAETG
jgi:putative transposase